MTDEKNEMTIIRIFNSTPEALFKMWTIPQQFAKWYGPNGFTIPQCKLDVRPGGVMDVKMKAPNGSIYPSPGVFREVIENKKLVFSLLSHHDDNGDPQMEMLNSLTFEEEEGGKTKMTMHIAVVKTISGVEHLKGLDFAWGQSFDKVSQILIS